MATIIRKDGPQPTSSSRTAQPIAFSFTDMRGQANDYVGTVRAEAAKIVQQAHQQAEQIRRQAEVAGRKAAEAAIERILDEKVAKRMQTLLPALEQLVREVNDMKGALLAEWERSAVKVSTAIAARVIRREVAHDPQIAIGTISDALRLATGATEIKLYVNPGDYTNLGSQVQRVAATLAQLAPSEIIADANISPGGCRVESQYGEVDQRIESQLRRIEEELT
ncbi:MAG TPA: FliH/SctL family protein [Lacipirellulaceae bacterium]|jgi:flagellar assembly protein FliH|nr:FliH/SctL family protein [Lacipirellulaceae bacterium]